MSYGMEYSMIAFDAFLTIYLNLNISEHFSTIDSVNGWSGKAILHVSSMDYLEHFSLIFHGNALAISGKNIENCCDYFPGDQ